MNYLIYGGARDTGKSESIYKITEYLINTKGYQLISGRFPTTFSDFRCIIEKEDNKILIQSYTDIVRVVKELKNERDITQGVTHIITANRNTSDSMRDKFRQILNITSTDYVFEIPLGKVVRGNTRGINLSWYLDGILNIAKVVINNQPFNF